MVTVAIAALAVEIGSLKKVIDIKEAQIATLVEETAAIKTTLIEEVSRRLTFELLVKHLEPENEHLTQELWLTRHALPPSPDSTLRAKVERLETAGLQGIQGLEAVRTELKTVRAEFASSRNREWEAERLDQSLTILQSVYDGLFVIFMAE
jgi:hypothetical protein